MVTQKDAIRASVIDTAERMCTAAITAPKARGNDSVAVAYLTGDELLAFADSMEKFAGESETAAKIFPRDAECVRKADAVVIIGSRRIRRGLIPCGLCGFENCAASAESGAHCSFDDIDLGIAIGSAVSVAADNRVDTRVMYTIGYAAMKQKLLGDDIETIMGIPLSATHKNILFDRK